jgi:hypothetical protein
MGFFNDPFKKEEKKKPKNIVKTSDKKFADRIKADFEYAKEKKDIEQWQKYDDYVEDKQWDTPTAKDKWKPQPQVNICWAVIRTIHAHMTGGQTSINVTSKRPGYDDIASDLMDVIDYYWDELDMDLKISEAEWIRPKIGSVALKSFWNPDLCDGDGDLDCVVVHPANVFIDPNINNPWEIQKAQFVDFVTPMPYNYIIRKYSKDGNPGSYCKYTMEQLKELLSPERDTSDTEIYGDTKHEQTTGVPLDIRGLDEGDEEGEYNSRDTINLHEYWYRDYDTDTLQIAWKAGNVVLKHSIDDPEIKEEGFYKHGKFPLTYIPYIQRDKRIDGRSELQALVSIDNDKDGIQDIINKLLQDYLVNERLVGQGQLAYKHGDVKSPEKITGEPGLLIPTRGDPARAIHRINGQNLNELLPVVDSMLTHADRITGQWDITQGRTNSSIKTLGQTSLLMEQAMKPQNDKVNTLNYGIRQMIELWIEMLAEFVTSDREYSRETTGMDGKKETEAFTFNPNKSIFEAPYRIKNPETGSYDDDTSKKREMKLYFKVKFDIGATLAMTKAYMMEIAFNLWQAQLIDIEGVYKLLPEFPGKAETMERMVQQRNEAKQQQEQQQMMAQAQQQQQMQAKQMEQQGAQKEQQTAQMLSQLPEEIQAALKNMLKSMTPDEQEQYLDSISQMPPEQLVQEVMQHIQIYNQNQ